MIFHDFSSKFRTFFRARYRSQSNFSRSRFWTVFGVIFAIFFTIFGMFRGFSRFFGTPPTKFLPPPFGGAVSKRIKKPCKNSQEVRFVGGELPRVSVAAKAPALLAGSGASAGTPRRESGQRRESDETALVPLSVRPPRLACRGATSYF